MLRRILIIDDDQAFVSTIKERLDFEGYEVVVANDGDEGLEVLERDRPDLVVLDIVMPKLNGYAFLKMLQSKHPGNKVSVIICTGRDDMMDMVKSEGISGFLVKPFDPSELVNMVNVTFQLQEGERQRQAPKPQTPRQAPATTPTPTPKPTPTTRATEPTPAKQVSKEVEPEPEVKKEPEAKKEAEAKKKKKKKTPEEPPPEEKEEEKPKAKEPESKLPAKVLVVDDELDFVEILKERLEFEGYEVLVAHNGQEGLEMAKSEKPNLILLDVMMPKVDGYMMCRLLKFDERFRDIPIIMLTARTMDKDRELGLSSGADDYITKPIDFDQLLEKAKNLLAMRAGVAP